MIPWCQTHSLSDMAAHLYRAASLLARMNAISQTISAVGLFIGDILALLMV